MRGDGGGDGGGGREDLSIHCSISGALQWFGWFGETGVRRGSCTGWPSTDLVQFRQ